MRLVSRTPNLRCCRARPEKRTVKAGTGLVASLQNNVTMASLFDRLKHIGNRSITVAALKRGIPSRDCKGAVLTFRCDNPLPRAEPRQLKQEIDGRHRQ